MAVPTGRALLELHARFSGRDKLEQAVRDMKRMKGETAAANRYLRSFAGAGTKAAAGARKVSADAKGAERALRRVASSAQQASKGVKRVGVESAKTAALLRKFSGAFLGLGSGVYVGVRALQEYVATIRDVERSQALLRAASGGNPILGGEQYGELITIANRYGRSLDGLSLQYGKLLAAARASGIELRDAQVLFEGVAAASSAMALSTFDTELSMQALVQIISKGTVQMEELRRQLAERFPGALGLVASALGVTTAELNKMVAAGQLSSERLVKVLGPALKRMYGELGIEASNLLGATEQKFGTALTLLTKALDETFSVTEGYSQSLRVLTSGMNALTEVFGGGELAASQWTKSLDGTTKSVHDLRKAAEDAERVVFVLGRLRAPETRRRGLAAEGFGVEQETEFLSSRGFDNVEQAEQALKALALSEELVELGAVQANKELIRLGVLADKAGKSGRIAADAMAELREKLDLGSFVSLRNARQLLLDVTVITKDALAAAEEVATMRQLAADTARRAFSASPDSGARADVQQEIRERVKAIEDAERSYRVAADYVSALDVKTGGWYEQAVKVRDAAKDTWDNLRGVTMEVEKQEAAYRAIATIQRRAKDSIEATAGALSSEVSVLEQQLRIWRTSEAQFDRDVDRLLEINSLERERASWLEAQLGLLASFGDISEDERQFLRRRLGLGGGGAADDGADAVEDARDFGMEFADNVRSNLRTALLQGDFSDVGSALVRALQATFIDSLLEGFFEGALGESLRNLGGSLASGIGRLFGGGRQSGGPVRSGMAYVVGEKRPELFVPGMSGTILPSVGMGMGGQGMQQTLVVVGDVDAATRTAVRQLGREISRDSYAQQVERRFT